MKKLIIIYFLLICTSCQKNNKRNQNVNEKLFEEINSIPDSTFVREILIDSTGKSLDTLSFTYYKENENGVQVYQQVTTKIDDDILEEENYFRENGELFYSKLSTRKFGTVSVFETFEKDGDLEKAISVEFQNGNANDTVFMDYENYKERGKLQKTIIKTSFQGSLGNTTELEYNGNGRIISETVKSGEDTLKLIEYNYQDGHLVNQITKDFKDSVLVKANYDNEGRILLKTIFSMTADSTFEQAQMNYKTDDKGNIIESVQTTSESKIPKERIIYQYN